MSNPNEVPERNAILGYPVPLSRSFFVNLGVPFQSNHVWVCFFLDETDRKSGYVARNIHEPTQSQTPLFPSLSPPPSFLSHIHPPWGWFPMVYSIVTTGVPRFSNVHIYRSRFAIFSRKWTRISGSLYRRMDLLPSHKPTAVSEGSPQKVTTDGGRVRRAEFYSLGLNYKYNHLTHLRNNTWFDDPVRSLSLSLSISQINTWYLVKRFGNKILVPHVALPCPLSFFAPQNIFIYDRSYPPALLLFLLTHPCWSPWKKKKLVQFIWLITAPRPLPSLMPYGKIRENGSRVVSGFRGCASAAV